MEIRASRKHGERFVRGVTAHGSAESDGVSAFLQKREVSAVSVVHKQGDAVRLAYARYFLYILYTAQIVGRGEVYRVGLSFAIFDGGPYVLRRYGTGAEMRTGFRKKPLNVKVKERRRVNKRLVSVSRR